MTYDETENLLRKYDAAYVKGELRSTEYETQIKQKQRIKSRHLIAENLFNEVTFSLNKWEKQHIHHLIDIYPNFKKLHGKASNETIILAFIFYVKLATDNDININKYFITSKYRLTHNTFERIICRLALNYLEEVYILPVHTDRMDNDILNKGKKNG